MQKVIKSLNGHKFWAFSSAVERSVHIGKAIGPIPIMPTKILSG